MFEEFQGSAYLGSHDAERRQSLGQLYSFPSLDESSLHSRPVPPGKSDPLSTLRERGKFTSGVQPSEGYQSLGLPYTEFRPYS